MMVILRIGVHLVFITWPIAAAVIPAIVSLRIRIAAVLVTSIAIRAARIPTAGISTACTMAVSVGAWVVVIVVALVAAAVVVLEGWGVPWIMTNIKLNIVKHAIVD